MLVWVLLFAGLDTTGVLTRLGRSLEIERYGSWGSFMEVAVDLLLYLAALLIVTLPFWIAQLLYIRLARLPKDWAGRATLRLIVMVLLVPFVMAFAGLLRDVLALWFDAAS